MKRKTKPVEREYFKEEQRFSNPALWIIAALVFTLAVAPMAIAIYQGFHPEKDYIENASGTISLIVLLVVLVLMCLGSILLFMKMKLVVVVNPGGLQYKFPPFILKTRTFGVEEIDTFEIRKYNPIREYGGWGLRYSWGKAGRAFNVKGNVGLQLYLKNGRKVLFGTQRPDALNKAMKKMMKEE